MGIIYNQKKRLLNLKTASSSYQIRITEDGYAQHLYYGQNVNGNDMSYLVREYDRGFSGNPYAHGKQRTLSLDTMWQEYSAVGSGDFRIHSLQMVNADGSRSADLRYTGHEIVRGKYSLPGLPSVYANEDEADTLILTLLDEQSGLSVRLYYGVLERYDVITRAVELVNTGAAEITLEKAASACLDLPYGRWDLIHFHGRHCMERMPERLPLSNAIQCVSSERGMSSHQHNPFLILCDEEANEDHGACIGAMLMYSGGFRAELEREQFGSTRLVMGLSNAGFSWSLAPGEGFFTPELILTYSDGLARMSQNFHWLIRDHVCRGIYQHAHRPVLLNSWEAMYFDISEEKLVSMASQAAELGVELFVMDDGWFGARNDDNAGLGDWFVNREKLPLGLGHLIERINALGLDFGIWVEPEMVNEDSALYRAHPDWALQIPGRPPTLGRNQLVLDLSREDVRAYLYECMSALLRENNIRYMKWDMNRCLADLFSAALPAGRQGETAHRCVLGVYALLERLTTEFPQVLFEGCAGGGGRFDAGLLYYTPQIWCSDDTDAIERLAIQDGTSYGYPVSAMGSHVSASPNHQTGRSTPLHTRAVVAMSGAFGYELDLEKLSEAEKEEIREQIERFRKDEALIHRGLYYRLSKAAEQPLFQAWEFVSPDGAKALMNVVVKAPQANAPLIHLHLKGLDAGAIYWIEETWEKISGAALMYGGYALPQLTGDYPALQLHLRREDA